MRKREIASDRSFRGLGYVKNPKNKRKKKAEPIPTDSDEDGNLDLDVRCKDCGEVASVPIVGADSEAAFRKTEWTCVCGQFWRLTDCMERKEFWAMRQDHHNRQYPNPDAYDIRVKTV